MSQALRSLLFEVDTFDAAAYITAIGVLLVCGIVAALVPAMRAASIDPVRALRGE